MDSYTNQKHSNIKEEKKHSRSSSSSSSSGESKRHSKHDKPHYAHDHHHHQHPTGHIHHGDHGHIHDTHPVGHVHHDHVHTPGHVHQHDHVHTPGLVHQHDHVHSPGHVHQHDHVHGPGLVHQHDHVHTPGHVHQHDHVHSPGHIHPTGHTTGHIPPPPPMTGHIAHPTDHITHPTGHVAHPTGHVHDQHTHGVHQTDYIVPPTGHVAHPTDHITHPTGHVAHPTGHVHDQHTHGVHQTDYIVPPTGHVHQTDHITHPTGHVAHPTGHVHDQHTHVQDKKYQEKPHPTLQPTHALENEKIKVDKHDQVELKKHDKDTRAHSKSPRRGKSSSKSPRRGKTTSKSPGRDKTGHAVVTGAVLDPHNVTHADQKRRISGEDRHRKISGGDKPINKIAPTEHERKIMGDQKVHDKLSGEQELYRKKQALDILRQLQILATSYTVEGGHKPGATNLLAEALDKAEDLLAKQAAQPSMDHDVRRTLEDLAGMVGSLKQLTRHKDIGDRMQTISEETKKAVEATQAPDLSNSTRRASEESIQLLDSWKPVFQLLISSREFRELINDVVQIARRVFLRHHEGLGSTVSEKFVSGAPVSEIGRMVSDNSSSSFKDEEGKIRLQMSDEEWDLIVEDMLRNVRLLQSNRNFKEGLTRLLNLGSLYRNQLRNSKDYVSNEVSEKHARRALKETQGLIATFTGRETLDNLYKSFRRLMKKADHDAETRTYMHEIKEFLLSDQTAAYSDSDLRRKIKHFIQKGRELSDKYRYAEEVEDLLDDVEEAMENIKNDEFVKVLRHNAGLVASDLSYVDNEGRVQMDMEMISKLRNTIAPYIAEFLKYIPIPRMEGSDAAKTYWVDDIVLCGYDIVPENVRFEIESSADFSVRDIETKQADTKLVIRLKNIRTELKDMEFYFKRLTFPEMSEHGRVSVRLGGEGAFITMTFRVYQDINDAFPRFVDGRADFSISKLDIIFDKSTLKHNVLVPMVISMMKSQIKRQVEVEVEKNLSKLLNTVGDKLTDALAQVNRPLLGSIGTFRQVVKGTGVSQVYERRREKLE